MKQDTKKTKSYGTVSKNRSAQLRAARAKKQQNLSNGVTASGDNAPDPTQLQVSSSSSTAVPSDTPVPTQLSAPSSSTVVLPSTPLQTRLPASDPSSSTTELPNTPVPTQLPTGDLPISASKRKLAYCSTSSNHSDETGAANSTSCNLPSTIVDLNCLAPLFENMLCPFCLQPTLILVGDSKKNCGLAIYLKVTCKLCDKEVASAYTSKQCETRMFDVNKRVGAAACATSMGYAGLNNFSELLNIPTLHHKTFNAHSKSISAKCEEFSRNFLAKAVEEVKKEYHQQTDDIKNVDVSFDGSWHKRGHTSKTGIGCVIERKTGLIIDYEILTSYCQICATTGVKLQGENILKYERWLAGHKPHCDANYEGPSGGMEKEAAVRMWSRSVLKNGLRYISMVSDGDGKTISEIHKLDPYPGFTVEKHECINHVGKRLGTALRNLVKTKSQEKPKVTLGGKGHGKLRPEVITQLQKYYTKAIRDNKTVPEMRQAIMAVLDHCRSTDNDQHHENCPSGKESWCFVQRATALGLPLMSHATEIGTPLCKLVADNIRPVFQRMSSTDLLSRCVLQSTQNVNESAHSVIWARCPKHVFAGRKRINIAVTLGAAEFNFGSTATREYMKTLNLPVGAETVKRGLKRDHTRVQKADLACTEKAKRFRQLKAEAKQREEEKLKEKFGDFYMPGEGD